MSEWKNFSLIDLAEILNNKRVPLSSMQRSNRKGDFPYYGASGVIDFVDDFIFEGEHVLISEDGENLRSRNTPIAFLANGKFWVNNHAHIVKGKKSFHNKLIVYALNNLDLNPFITGAVQPKLNRTNLVTIPFYLPCDESEQQAIAEVLSSIDDKIDLLNRQNETLEAMAQTLFRQWFIEDWKNKALSNGILGDLFVTIESGKRPKGGIDSRIRDVPSIGAENVKGIGKHDYSKEKYVSFDYYNSMKKGRISDGDILVYKDGGTPGEFKPKFGMVGKGFPHNQACINEHVFRCVPKTSSRCYSFALLNTAMVKFELEERGTGAAIPGINGSAFKSVPVVIPSIEALNDFEMTVGPFYDKILTNAAAIRKLSEFRDILLPKLMSGAVRVKLD